MHVCRRNSQTALATVALSILFMSIGMVYGIRRNGPCFVFQSLLVLLTMSFKVSFEPPRLSVSSTSMSPSKSIELFRLFRKSSFVVEDRRNVRFCAFLKSSDDKVPPSSPSWSRSMILYKHYLSLMFIFIEFYILK